MMHNQQKILQLLNNLGLAPFSLTEHLLDCTPGAPNYSLFWRQHLTLGKGSSLCLTISQE